MKDIKTKPAKAASRRREAARIPKEALRRVWLRGKEKGRAEIEDAADSQQESNYSEANHIGEKVADTLQSAGKSSAEMAIRKGYELVKKRAGQRRIAQRAEQQEQTDRQSFPKPQAPDSSQASSPTEPRECSVPAGKENLNANSSRRNDSAKRTSGRNAKPNRLSVKEKPRNMKIAPHEIRGVSRDQKRIRTAVNAVQSEQAAQQKARQLAQRTQQSAKSAVKQTRKTAKAARSAIRHLLAALHTMTAAIVTGMSAATAVIIIICLVAFIAGSAYGIFFAAEAPDKNSITVQQAVERLTGEWLIFLKVVMFAVL